MKKPILLIQLIAIAMLYSSQSYADDDDWEGDYYAQPQINYYYSPPPVYNYYPQPQVNYYYPQPQVNYYPAPPQQYAYDQRSHQGLAGGVLGSVFGYEMGSGNPLATGLGAATGSFFGNGF